MSQALRSVETVKEDRSSAKGNSAQATQNEFATRTRTTSRISLWLLTNLGVLAARHRVGEQLPSAAASSQSNLDLHLHSPLTQVEQLL